jgi:plastocyanin
LRFGRPAVALLLFVFAGIGAACQLNADDDDPEATVTQSIEVEAYDFYFEETSILLELGARVSVDFTNAGEQTHSFTVPDLDLEIEAESGESTEFSFTLPNEPGLLNFYCKYHPDQMKGTISIGGDDAPLDENNQVDESDADVEVDTNGNGY